MLKTIKQKGFTLIEVLLVVAIIAILAGIVILAINPGKQLADTRNSQRQSDVNSIINAVYQYSIDNNGKIPTGITASATDICTTGTAAATCTTDGTIDLSVLTNSGKYLVSVPKDPSTATATDTHYQVSKDANDRLVVNAPDAEQSKTISVTR